MAILDSIKREDIIAAMQYIDEQDVPHHNQSLKYVVSTEDGKEYPPKYVVAVAEHLKTGSEINTENFNSIEAKEFLEKMNFIIVTKQDVQYELTITSESITSTDDRFTMDNISLGDNYQPLNSYFEDAQGNKVYRDRIPSERKASNQVLPRLACQVFEKKLMELSEWDKKSFPVCRYSPTDAAICGIYPTVEEFAKDHNAFEHMEYKNKDGLQFVFYSWNIFSTVIFVQECLKRFGKEGDKFVLRYKEKDKKDAGSDESLTEQKEQIEIEETGLRNEYSKILLKSRNIIFHGAPGTGKSYLAQEIAADLVSNGYYDKIKDLTQDQKTQIEFVQFHPNYDYSDFVEGLRPVLNTDGSMGFKLKDGVFKQFVNKARLNYENSKKTKEAIQQQHNAEVSLESFLDGLELGVTEFSLKKGKSKFVITSFDDEKIYILNTVYEKYNEITLEVQSLKAMLESASDFSNVEDVRKFFGKKGGYQEHSYYLALYLKIKESSKNQKTVVAQPEQLKNYVFIIDEINRGEISKIFGELFFSIEPDRRGENGAVATQYSNMHSNPDEKFYIPENVYIIGTMNDIDRSVDTFDFAMRRRFRFIEIKANDHLEALDSIEDDDCRNDAIARMTALNNEISKVEGLNENYHIGAAYFAKLAEISANELWEDSLEPLLKDYVHGMYNEEDILKQFATAYGYSNSNEESVDEAN